MIVSVSLFAALMAVHVAFALCANGRKAMQREQDCSQVLMPVWPFVVVMFSGLKPRTTTVRIGAVLQTLLFAAGCLVAARHGALTRHLLSPVFIGTGLLAGHLVFCASILVTHGSFRLASSHLADVGALWDYLVESPRVLMQFASVSIAEEVIYRAALQPLAVTWLGPLFGIAAVALLFSIVHDHFFKNSLLQSSEFLAFALLLGILYYWTGSLILVIVIHTARNIEIAYLERVAQLEEAGDSDAAQRQRQFLDGTLVQALVVLPGPEMPMAILELSEPVPGEDSRPLNAQCAWGRPMENV